MALGIHHALGDTLSLDDGTGHRLVTYHYGPDEPRSYLHPVAPLGAPPLSLRPHDHIWHHGLFFAWKFVDETGFWEHGKGHVVSQRLSITTHTPEEVAWEQRNDWIQGLAPDGPVLLREERTVRLRLEDERRYTIHWHSIFHTDQERRLHSVPGRGYAGIGIRLIRDFQSHPRLLGAGGQNDVPTVRGAREPWAAWQGRYDATLGWAGIALFEHPSNPGFPAPVFVGKQLADMAFLGSGFVFDRDFVLRPAEPLSLAYAFAVHRGEATEADYVRWYEAYRTTPLRTA
jgi:hypothetical protein